MSFRDLKYILAYVTPLSCWISLTYNGIFSYTTLIFLFILIPIAEQFAPGKTSNLNQEEEQNKLKSVFFDLLLYLNFPILYLLIYLYFQQLNTGNLGISDIAGKTLAIGIIISTIGINVAHEVGHRSEWYNQLISRLMLLPALYMHFNIEHNKGHHKWVATPLDPATSRRGESFYRFWWRTVSQSYLSAWRIEKQDLSRIGSKVLSYKNKMILFTIVQVGALVAIGFYFNLFTVLMAIVIAVIGFSLLEAVNYIEHYGLVRDLLPSGKYGPVESRHSWNSNHDIGRVLLYELTRHSDHHYKSTRKYQVLRHFNESPQLPMGYPASILMATIPSLWFKVMDRLLPEAQE